MSRTGTSENPAHIGILDKIRNLKYMYNAVEYDEDTNKFHLIQKKNTIESLEAPHSNEVISYVFGVFESKTKTKKTGKKEIKTKTRKLRIEEDESSPTAVDTVTAVEKSQEFIGPPSKLPIIGTDGTITWQDENYKKAWNKLSQKHKEELAKDLDWLQESMDSYAKDNEERKDLKFVYPRSVIFPPRRLEDDTYDFGNEIYNQISNTNKELLMDYLKDLARIGKPGNNVTKELADTWFKGRIEAKVYDFLYPVRSQMIVR
jgi:hypothetical protein